MLCCPEDVERSPSCRHSEDEVCAECSVPLCASCEQAIVFHQRRSAPMVLGNDNFWGYTTDIIYRYQVRWIETAVVSPIWTTMLVYYVEGDYGHLYDEEVGRQRFRTAVRGTCCSFHMPWEDILEELREKTLDKELQEIPRPQECLKYMWRAHVKVAGVDLKKQLKQVHVRPFVLVLLLDYLIEQRHEVFVGKGSAEELRQRMRAAVAREYPEQEADIPEEERQGTMPPSILEVLRAQEADKMMTDRQSGKSVGNCTGRRTRRQRQRVSRTSDRRRFARTRVRRRARIRRR